MKTEPTTEALYSCPAGETAEGGTPPAVSVGISSTPWEDVPSPEYSLKGDTSEEAVSEEAVSEEEERGRVAMKSSNIKEDVRCPRPRAHVVRTSTGEVLEEVPCRLRTCPVCGPRLRSSHVAHFTEILAGLGSLWAFTLTVDRAVGLSPEQTRRYIVSRFDLFRKGLRSACRRRGGELAYVAALEAHESGSVHLHAVASVPLDDAATAVRRRWFAAGGGASMDVRPVEPEQEAVAMRVGYVLKRHFGPGADPSRLMTSKAHGYRTAAAKAARRAHVQAVSYGGDMQDVVFDELRPAPRRGARHRAERAADRERARPLRMDARRTRYVERVPGGRYGVRHTLDPATGAVRHDVVGIEWDGEVERFVELARGLGESEAKATAERWALRALTRENPGGATPAAEEDR